MKHFSTTAGRATRKRQRTSLTEGIPVAVVQGHVYGNPVLGQTAAATPPLANPDCDGLIDLGKFETPPDLFEAVLNEDAAANGMNSNEFKEFIKNLSYSSKKLSFIPVAVL
jgi:hypothetical protein